jgi:hypothetical protein
VDAGLAYLPVWLRPWPTWAAGALFVVAAAALSSLGAGGHAPGSGALFTVTDCATYGDATRAGTLAYELALENSGPSPVGDTITFDCGAAPVTIAVPATIVISHDLTISGGSSQVTLSGSDTVRVFSVSTGAHLSLSRLTIAHGRGAGISVGEGGAILNAGTLTVSECIFEANVADGANGDGGAVSNEGGSVTVTDTTFANNTAHGVEAVGGAL